MLSLDNGAGWDLLQSLMAYKPTDRCARGHPLQRGARRMHAPVRGCTPPCVTHGACMHQCHHGIHARVLA
jgi:hypothetical protein